VSTIFRVGKSVVGAYDGFTILKFVWGFNVILSGYVITVLLTVLCIIPFIFAAQAKEFGVLLSLLNVNNILSPQHIFRGNIGNCDNVIGDCIFQ
jgi:hypothetical protein